MQTLRSCAGAGVVRLTTSVFGILDIVHMISKVYDLLHLDHDEVHIEVFCMSKEEYKLLTTDGRRKFLFIIPGFLAQLPNFCHGKAPPSNDYATTEATPRCMQTYGIG